MQTNGIKAILFNIQITMIGCICLLLGSYPFVVGIILIAGSFISSARVLSKQE